MGLSNHEEALELCVYIDIAQESCEELPYHLGSYLYKKKLGPGPVALGELFNALQMLQDRSEEEHLMAARKRVERC